MKSSQVDNHKDDRRLAETTFNTFSYSELVSKQNEPNPFAKGGHVASQILAGNNGPSAFKFISPNDKTEKKSTSNNSTRDGRKWILKEQQRWNEAVTLARDRGFSIKGFYHTSTWQPFWQDVIEEQLLLMDGKRQLNHFLEVLNVNRSFAYSSSKAPNGKNIFTKAGLLWGPKYFASVLEAVDQLFINVAGKTSEDLNKIKNVVDNLKLKNRNRIVFNFNRTTDRSRYQHGSDADRLELGKDIEISEGEYSTVKMLHEYCTDEVRQGRKSFVFYLHNKGACCSRKNQKFSPVASWREAMNTFTIEFPSVCLRALLSGYLTCGFEYQVSHYSGNFWWADCDHVSALPPVHTRFDAWIVEFFLFNTTANPALKETFAENCGFSTHNCRGVDHYHQECPRSSYKQKLIDYIDNAQLPFSEVATVKNTEEWRRKYCAEANKVPYMMQPWWPEHNWAHFPFARTQEPIYKITAPN